MRDPAWIDGMVLTNFRIVQVTSSYVGPTGKQWEVSLEVVSCCGLQFYQSVTMQKS